MTQSMTLHTALSARRRCRRGGRAVSPPQHRGDRPHPFPLAEPALSRAAAAVRGCRWHCAAAVAAVAATPRRQPSSGGAQSRKGAQISQRKRKFLQKNTELDFPVVYESRGRGTVVTFSLFFRPLSLSLSLSLSSSLADE